MLKQLNKNCICFFFVSCLTRRSIMAEQAREKYSNDFEHWPRRSDPLRATIVPQISKTDKAEPNNNSLSRCRSLELLGDKKFTTKKLEQSAKGNLHRSYDLLNNTEQHEAIIHHSMLTDFDTSKSSSIQQSTNTSESERKFEHDHLRASSKYTLDFREKMRDTLKESTLSDDELEDFTNKTKELIQIKRATRRRLKEKTLSELRDRQKMIGAFPKLSINLGHTDATSSVDNIEFSSIEKLNRSPYKYPNDFDDISMEMKNITKLLGSSIEPLESAPSTSSSFYRSNNKLPTKIRMQDEIVDGSSQQSDDDLSISNQLPNTSNAGKPLGMLGNGGFFQNTCFENQSSSSCNTLKSVEMTKPNNGEFDDEDTDYEVKSQIDYETDASQTKRRTIDLSKSNSEQEISKSTNRKLNGKVMDGIGAADAKKSISFMQKYMLSSNTLQKPSSSGASTIKSPPAMNYTLSTNYTIGQVSTPSSITTDSSASVGNLEPLKPLLHVPSFIQNTHHLPQITSNGGESYAYRQFNVPFTKNVNNNDKFKPNLEQKIAPIDRNLNLSTPNVAAAYQLAVEQSLSASTAAPKMPLGGQFVHKATIHSTSNSNHYENSEHITQSN